MVIEWIIVAQALTIYVLIQIGDFSSLTKKPPVQEDQTEPRQGWEASIRKRNGNPRHTVFLDVDTEQEAVKLILQKGYRPEDVRDLYRSM